MMGLPAAISRMAIGRSSLIFARRGADEKLFVNHARFTRGAFCHAVRYTLDLFAFTGYGVSHRSSFPRLRPCLDRLMPNDITFFNLHKELFKKKNISFVYEEK